LLESHSPHVYCTDILPSPAEAEWKIAQETAEKYGSKVEYRQLDITDEETVDKTFESMYNDCETPIGAFFGAAGIQQQIPALDYPAKDFRRIMEVNVTGESPAAGNETDRQVPSSRSRLLLDR
jgi:NAD(P)-dependent dehydrogenase (short-subunit alcohol dehydrogenase family)